MPTTEPDEADQANPTHLKICWHTYIYGSTCRPYHIHGYLRPSKHRPCYWYTIVHEKLRNSRITNWTHGRHVRGWTLYYWMSKTTLSLAQKNIWMKQCIDKHISTFSCAWMFCFFKRVIVQGSFNPWIPYGSLGAALQIFYNLKAKAFYFMFCRLLVRGQVNSGQRRPCEGCEGPSGRVADHGCGFLRIGASVKSVARSAPAALWPSYLHNMSRNAGGRCDGLTTRISQPRSPPPSLGRSDDRAVLCP